LAPQLSKKPGAVQLADVERWVAISITTPMPLDLVIGDTTPSPSWPRSTCSKSCASTFLASLIGRGEKLAALQRHYRQAFTEHAAWLSWHP
jgi:hypothetical protein